MVKFWHKSHTKSSMATIYQRAGENIRRLRKKSGLTQEELAELARMDPKSIIEIEAGKRNPTLKTISKIARALKVPLPNLLRFQSFKLSPNCSRC